MRAIKGALEAPFLFVGFVLTAISSVEASPMLWVSALAVLAGVAVLEGTSTTPGATPIALVVAGFAAWTVANDFINAPYTVAGIFHPTFLLAGFFAGRSGKRIDRNVNVAAAAGAALLAIWALCQTAGGEPRAHAHFETPNTLASVINLVLAPLLVRLAYGEPRRALLGLALLLATALACTSSRGGVIALAGGVLAASLLFRRAPSWRGAALVSGVLVAGAAAAVVAMQLPGWLGSSGAGGQNQLQSVATTLAPTLASRRELYELAFSAAGKHPWLGSGYLFFNSLLEAQRAHVPSYASQNITYFVHDDYLQVLLELGLPGLLALLALVALPGWLALRSHLRDDDRLAVHAALAGIATMAIHALGDFPFYVPLCLVLFGVLLGQIDRLLEGQLSSSGRQSGRAARWRTIGIATLLVVLLVPPPLAEAAAAYGEHKWHAGAGQPAAYGFELAWRLQPLDWRYRWYAGQFWYAQAIAGNANAAPLADQAFAAAVAANPRDPRPLLARLATQMRFGPMLGDRQPAVVLRAWADHALALAPLNPSVRRDHAAALEALARDR